MLIDLIYIFIHWDAAQKVTSKIEIEHSNFWTNQVAAWSIIKNFNDRLL